MPVLDDPMSGRIRSVLVSVPVEVGDLGVMEQEVRRRAARRRRAGRVVAVVATVLVGVVSIGVVHAVGDDERVITDPVAPSTTVTTRAYGFGPLTPLIDAPLPEVPLTRVTTIGDQTLFVESTPTKLGLRLDKGTSAASLGGEPMRMNALVSAASGPPPETPGPMTVFGVTRSEAATVEVTLNDHSRRVPVVRISQLPQLAFFVVEFSVAELRAEMFVSVYDDDGRLLTDNQRISGEHGEFEQAMDDRLGVEWQRAAITAAEVRSDELSIELTVHNCGAEAHPTWTESDNQVSISVQVKLPTSHGDCIDGPTTRIGVGLDRPLAGRAIVDADTERIIQ